MYSSDLTFLPCRLLRFSAFLPFRNETTAVSFAKCLALLCLKDVVTILPSANMILDTAQIVEVDRCQDCVQCAPCRYFRLQLMLSSTYHDEK